MIFLFIYFFAVLYRRIAAVGNLIDPCSGSIAVDCLETGMWRNPLAGSFNALQHDVAHGFKDNTSVAESSPADRSSSFVLQ